MPFPKIAGISGAYQCELIGLLDDLAGTKNLDRDVARRALWLKWGLEGRAPGAEPLPFADDAGPLVPVVGEPAVRDLAFSDR